MVSFDIANKKHCPSVGAEVCFVLFSLLLKRTQHVDFQDFVL